MGSSLKSTKLKKSNNRNRTWMGEKSLIDIKLDETDLDRLRETRMQNPV